MNKTLLDPSCGRGEFLVEAARRMINAGCTCVLDRIYAADSSEFNLRITKKRLEHLAISAGNQSTVVFNNVMHYNTYNEFQDLVKDMKFDVIVGNPPYQENTKSDKENKQGDFWFKFLKLATDLTDGYIAFVTPKSIFSSGRFGSDNHKVTYLINKGFGFKSIWTSVDNHFDVGIKIVSFILEKNHKGSTKLVDINQSVDIDTSIPIPFFLDKINMSIIKKCYNNDNRWPFKECIKANDVDYVIAINAGRFKTYNKLYIGPQTDNPNSAAQGMFIDESQVESYKSIFNSKLFKYIFRVMGGEDAQSSTGILQGLPYVEPNKIYTDQELYTKFALSQDEVDRIDQL